MFRRPRHAAPLVRTARQRGQDWLDRKINKPLKPNTVRIRKTEDIGPVVSFRMEPISWELSAGAVSPEFIKLMFGSVPGDSYRSMASKARLKRRPFDWKLDAEEVA